MFGTDPMTPEMEEGIQIARKENPNLAPVQSYGLLSRLLQPRAQAYTSPGRSIYLNPSTLQGQSPQDVADTITHEQQHVSQMGNRGYGPTRELLYQMFGSDNLPYHQRPDEIEAFQAERLRRSRMGRPQTVTPSFSTGQFRTSQDVDLPTYRK